MFARAGVTSARRRRRAAPVVTGVEDADENALSIACGT
jgi:hypothetical protein